MEKLEFKIINAGIALETTKLKIQESLKEIEKKHPNREDLIKSMSESLNDVWNIQAVFNWLRENRETQYMDFYKTKSENSDLLSEVASLKKELQTIKKNITL